MIESNNLIITSQALDGFGIVPKVNLVCYEDDRHSSAVMLDLVEPVILYIFEGVMAENEKIKNKIFWALRERIYISR